MSAILYTNCQVVTLTDGVNSYGLIENGIIVAQAERILWVGDAINTPDKYLAFERVDLGGHLVTPSFIDCHTHLVFAGNRAEEFEMRLEGVSYADIAKKGGGIISTVNATRAASDETLLSQSLKRLDALIAEGVAVIEIKSGYGLTIDHEIRMLRIARKLGEKRNVKIVTTWLAAHALPPEYAGRADAYIDEVVIEGLSRAVQEDLVDAVDGFCETIGFSPRQIEKLFLVAQSFGLPVKLHAEQLSDQKGALLAARYNGLSADHLEYLQPDDVEIFAASGTVAVLLPGAFYTLKETKLPPMGALRKYGVDLALATDCNPGSSPISSILTIMNMAAIEFGMTPLEALLGVTRCGAKALGLSDDYGTIEAGKILDLAVWDVSHPAQLTNWMGGNPFVQRIKQGT
ncbi:MAG: imidazolonepropionase [Litorimonas sp.]